MGFAEGPGDLRNPDTMRSAMQFRDDAVLAMLLVVGLFFPCSVGGEYSLTLLGIMLLILGVLVLYLFWTHGTSPGSLSRISIPIVVVLVACTFMTLSHAFRFAWGVFAEFGLLALIFSLDLRRVRPGRLVSIAFVISNVIWIVCGAGVLIGNEWVGQFLTAWYSQFYSELLPMMLGFHKPILTFGTHSLAGFFTYLFFWVNWERFTTRRNRLFLAFAVCELMLLIGLTSFTSLIFATVAACQIAYWLWKQNRRALLVSLAPLALLALLAAPILASQIDVLNDKMPTLSNAILNFDTNGPFARFGTQGTLRPTLDYLWEHPFSPIGLTSPDFLFYGDSGPVQYFLRGSVPLLLLVYVGLYRFLRYNVRWSQYAVGLFIVILAFEMGFQGLPYFRTIFLLPFLVVCFNQLKVAEQAS
jgi:hypothetical protein